ncbi:MAG: hypothetical protein U0S50_02735 [Sphingopyxis sp.]|uniref:hypothetical protein n=1 Tax=Sphingopyxis sp. TaxID=1908224 RepID=UPI002ABAB084|nr:hypothetical protein [Sphingopyxis sp.]MDZ3830718.1 hypothetical protein [Sphingopyxis sp.]
MRKTMIGTGAAALVLALAACTGEADGSATPHEGAAAAAKPIAESLAPFGDGYPGVGDPCRRLGESAATSAYLDDSMILVGCPDQASAAALGGTAIGMVEGAHLVSMPMDDADAAMDENGPPPPADPTGDALVPGTDYHATTQISCGFGGAAPTGQCAAGVKRNFDGEGTAVVEVTKPDGRKRALFFQGTTPIGADSAQSDGSAGWDFKVTRKGDQSSIRFGPEAYVIVDALIEGG